MCVVEMMILRHCNRFYKSFTIALLKDEDDYVKIPAVDSLFELNRPRLRQVWIDALDLENCYVSEIAIKALANLDLLIPVKNTP